MFSDQCSSMRLTTVTWSRPSNNKSVIWWWWNEIRSRGKHVRDISDCIIMYIITGAIHITYIVSFLYIICGSFPYQIGRSVSIHSWVKQNIQQILLEMQNKTKTISWLERTRNIHNIQCYVTNRSVNK